MLTWIAVAAVFAVSLQSLSYTLGIMPRHVVAAVLIPLWVPALKRWIGARLLVGAGIVAVLSGVVTAQISSIDHHVTVSAALEALIVLLGFIGGTGIILWARGFISLRAIGLVFAVGFLVNASVSTGNLGGTNPLKFVFALPLIIGVLAVLSDKRPRYQAAALVLLIGVTAVADARSLFGMCLVALAFVMWQMRPLGRIPRVPSWAATATLIATVGLIVYAVGTELLVDGYLGEEAQQRSQAQIDASGSLILGGRPEIAATAALFQERPFGFGAGVPANYVDLMIAKQGLSSIDYDPDNGYVESYMFSKTVIELHSVAGDLWVTFGLGGLLLALVLVWSMVKAMSVQISRRSASGLVLVLACMGLWSMAFGPFYSASRTLILAVGLILVERTVPTGAPLDKTAEEPPTRGRNRKALPNGRRRTAGTPGR